MLNCAFSHEVRAKGSKGQVWMKAALRFVSNMLRNEAGLGKRPLNPFQIVPFRIFKWRQLRYLDGFRAEHLFLPLVREVSSHTPKINCAEYLQHGSDMKKWNNLPAFLPSLFVCLSMPTMVWGHILLPLLQSVETRACKLMLLWANSQKPNRFLYRTGLLHQFFQISYALSLASATDM